MPTRYAGILAAACLLICLPALRAIGAEAVSDRQIIHVLNRLAFGPTLEDFRRVKTIGIDRYIAEQLDPDSIPEVARTAVARRCAGYAQVQRGSAPAALWAVAPDPRLQAGSRTGEGAT